MNKPPEHKIYEKVRVKLFEKITESILSDITLFLEDNDHKPVGFFGETRSFTCQLIQV